MGFPVFLVQKLAKKTNLGKKTLLCVRR